MFVSELQGRGSRVDHPFSSVLVNQNDLLTGVIDVQVTTASHFSADTFRITAAISKLPPNLNITYWGDSVGDELEIFAGVDATTGQKNSLIYGQVDDVDIDLCQQTITLTGRDLSARFLDNRTAEYFTQQHASDIVQTFATLRGLKASVTPTKQKVGGYYAYYHSRLNKDQSEWDVLTFLAEQEGYDLWVSGQTLNFQPPVPENADPYVLLWSDQGTGNFVANMIDLKLRRSETLARDVKVIVKSWNQSQATVVTAENRRSKRISGKQSGGSGSPQTYTFFPPNLNKEQADKYAAAKAEDITKHERVITGMLPGDNILNNRSLIKLVGTNTSWDQLYNVDTVTRHISTQHGYTMDFRAKNHSTQSTIII